MFYNNLFRYVNKAWVSLVSLSFDRKTLLDDVAKAEKFISADFPLKSVHVLGIADWKLSGKTNEMFEFHIFQVEVP